MHMNILNIRNMDSKARPEFQEIVDELIDIQTSFHIDNIDPKSDHTFGFDSLDALTIAKR